MQSAVPNRVCDLRCWVRVPGCTGFRVFTATQSAMECNTGMYSSPTHRALRGLGFRVNESGVRTRRQYLTVRVRDLYSTAKV